MFNKLKKVAQIPIIIVYLFTALFSAVPFSHAENSDEQVFYYLQDHLGGVDAVVDENGKVVERKDYLPYGDKRLTVGASDSPTTEDYGFTGKEQDDESGLYYYGARYYDPQIGRFTQIDPLVLGESEKPLSDVLNNPQVLNGYSYVLNNPMKYVDENGMWQVPVHFDATLFVAKSAGFTDTQALSIASNDQYIDVNKTTSPWNIDNGWMHFVSEDASSMWLDNTIINKSDTATFGNYLHYYQDSYSHFKKGYNWFTGGHILDSIISTFGLKEKPDKTYDNPADAKAMFKGTFDYTRKYIKYVIGMGDMSEAEFDEQSVNLWNDAENTIDNFIKANDEAQKDYFGLNETEKKLKEFVTSE